jgi:hypothetical protein
MAQRRWLLPLTLILGATISVGCGDDSSGSGGGGAQTPTVPTTTKPTTNPPTVDPTTNIDVVDNGFESDDPNGRSDTGGTSGGTSGSSSGGDAAGGKEASPAAPSDNAGSAQRTIEEADIVKLDGTLLYALSQYGGLAVIDVSDPDHMKLLGRKRTDGLPFEMYVEHGKAYVMMNNFGRWVESADHRSGQWVETSELLTFDVSNPTAIKEISHYDVPGEVSDSRLIGDTLYLVTFENGYCWNCGSNAATVVTSFDTSNTISKVDQIGFRAPNNQYAYGRRSVSATNQRLYIGGPSWDWDGWSDTNRYSVIQVVDISDIAGHLKRGADVKIDGRITNRWQMDEYEGYLRVISQYGNGWWWGGNTNVNPVVQTFKVDSASSITLAGQTQLALPEPEALQSVRFDGIRGYAITAHQTDPLYTIDLSNPATPKQAGTLQMPGSIFHMEPRGDRLVGFGYDGTQWNSNLAVSLFDVADLTTPKMLSRVSFGAGWGNIAEDQDRIHKAVRVLDDQGTILVPFASYGRWDQDASKCQAPQSGIQIIDYAKTGLTLRGLAPHYGQPRRAMLLPNNRLLGMSDRTVSTFDITSRDAPAKKNEIDLSNPAYRMVETATHIASMTNDWWSGEPMLSLTPKANADDANATGKVSLAALAPVNQYYCGSSYSYTAWYDARLFVRGNIVWMTVPVYNWDPYGQSAGRVVVATIDTSNPAAPTITGRTTIPLSRPSYGYYGYGGCMVGYDGWYYYSYWGGMYGGIVGAGDSFVQVGNKLAYLEVLTDWVDQNGNKYDPSNPNYDWRNYHYEYSRKLHVVDLTNPANILHESPVQLPASLGTTPLQVMNGQVLTSRWVPSPTNKGKVRFYVDRVDLNGATTPLSSVNVPGSLLQVDAPSNRIVTTDYHVSRTPATDWSECYYDNGYRGYFDYDKKECVVVNRDFKLSDLNGAKVTLRQTFVPPSQAIGGVQLADDRIYMTHYTVYDYKPYNPAVPYEPPTIAEEGGLWAIGGLRAGNLSIVSQLDADAQWPLAANGTKVAVYQTNGLAIYDTATSTPKLVSAANLRGYGYSSYLLVSQDHAVASLGEWGIQTLKY